MYIHSSVKYLSINIFSMVSCPLYIFFILCVFFEFLCFWLDALTLTYLTVKGTMKKPQNWIIKQLVKQL